MTNVTSFDLTTSLAGSVNGIASNATFTRAAGVSTVEDHLGVIHECLDGESRFWGARREVAPAAGLDSGTDYGANVNGVKYFDTDTSGNPLTDMRGCLVEAASTNYFLTSDVPATQATMTNGGLVESTITVTGTTEITVDGTAVTSAAPYTYTPAGATSNVVVTTVGDGTVQFETGGYSSTYIPTDGTTKTRAVETLTTPRPTLTDAQWNELTIGIDTYTVSDDANADVTGTVLFVQADTNDNSINIKSELGTFYKLVKRRDAVDVQIQIIGNSTSIKRSHVAVLSPVTGITYDINGSSVGDTDAVTLKDMSLGTGDIQLGSFGAILPSNAGISKLNISIPTVGGSGSLGNGIINGIKQRPTSKFNTKF